MAQNQQNLKTLNRSRNWCWTLNNYEPNPEEWLPPMFGNFKYLIFGKEVGEEGTPHLQGYVDWINPRALGGLKKIDNRIHWEIRRGTWDEAVDYCKEDGDWYEFGKKNEQGTRSDIQANVTAILNGTLRCDDLLLENFEHFHQYGRSYDRVEDIAICKRERTWMTKCTYLCGPSGSGKSHRAFRNYTQETHYVYNGDNGWWENYKGQEIVIFDDFRGEIPYNFLLKLCDKYPLRIRRRNRCPIPFLAKKIYITSVLKPEELYHNVNARDGIDQLLRRIKLKEIGPAQKYPGVILETPGTLLEQIEMMTDA